MKTDQDFYEETTGYLIPFDSLVICIQFRSDVCRYIHMYSESINDMALEFHDIERIEV